MKGLPWRVIHLLPCGVKNERRKKPESFTQATSLNQVAKPDFRFCSEQLRKWLPVHLPSLHCALPTWFHRFDIILVHSITSRTSHLLEAAKTSFRRVSAPSLFSFSASLIPMSLALAALPFHSPLMHLEPSTFRTIPLRVT